MAPLFFVYALLCGALLVHNVYAGLIAAMLPGVAVGLLPQSEVSTGLGRRSIAAWFLLAIAAFPWQVASFTAIGEVSTGSQTNVAKFAVTAVALLLAFSERVPRLKFSRSVNVLFGYCAAAIVGGLVGIDPSSSLLRASRFVIVVIGLIWITSRVPRSKLVALFIQFAVALSLVSLGARMLGLSAHMYGGRLEGYFPPLHPNELGMLAAGGLLCTVALAFRRELAYKVVLAYAVILIATLVLTQSRTSMIAFLAGLLGLAGPQLWSRGPIIIGTFVVALLVTVFLQTNTENQVLTSLLTHNGSTTTTSTLGSRQSEWEGVLRLNDKPLYRAVGQGLAAKSVEVNLISTRYAPVDGTWSAAYLSAGAVGVLLLAYAVLLALKRAFLDRDDIALAVLIFLLVSSITANVFNDVSIGLVLFLSIGVSNFRSSSWIALKEGRS